MFPGKILSVITSCIVAAFCAISVSRTDAHAAAPKQTREDVASTVLAMERAALDRWGKGDPDGFLEITDADVVYFDPFQVRLTGIDQLRKMYDTARGKIKIDKYEIVDPVVMASGDIAVLTFNFVSHGSEGAAMRWNTTEVYRRRNGQWRIIHTHWSLTQPKLQQ